MKLSEAIRLGSMLKPQAFHCLRDARGGVCASGAAFDAIGVLDALCADVGKLTLTEIRSRNQAIIAAVAPQWILLLNAPTVCPQCGQRSAWLLIPHLNDRHRWTRERIADWVETIENAQEATTLQPKSAEASCP